MSKMNEKLKAEIIENSKVAFGGLGMAIIFFPISVGAFSEEMHFFGILFLLLAIISSLFTFVGFYFLFGARKRIETETKQEERARRAFAAEHPHYEAEKFYSECLEAGFSKIETTEEKARFELYLKKNGIQGSPEKMIQKFKLGKSEIARIEKNKKKQEKLSALMAISKENRKYITKFGREKYRAVCNENIGKLKSLLKECEHQYQNIMNNYNRGYNLLKTPENSWATMGGIATGLAGGAAGVATAIEAQTENMQIRESNQNLLTSLASMSISSTASISDKMTRIKTEIDRYEKIADKIDELLIEEENSNKFIDHLTFNVKKTERLDDFIVATIDISPDTFFIYDTVNACVDGVIEMSVNFNSEISKTVRFSLPEFGVNKKTSIEVVCRGCPKSKINEVNFKPQRLWAVEKI